jgi:hypothetical protein
VSDKGVSLGQAKVIKDSGKALLVEADELDAEEWIPKSQIHEDSEIFEDGQEDGELIVSTWLARERGWA